RDAPQVGAGVGIGEVVLEPARRRQPAELVAQRVVRDQLAEGPEVAAIVALDRVFHGATKLGCVRAAVNRLCVDPFAPRGVASARMNSSPDRAALRALVARFASRPIAVLGDVMLDRYLWGRADRISPEAPAPGVEIERESFTLGGAANVAANLKALGAEPVLLGVVGADDDGRRLRATLEERGLA